MEIFTGNIGNTHKTVLLQVWRKYISLHTCGNFDPSEHPDSPRINSWTRGLKISCRFLLDCTISILERNLLIYIFFQKTKMEPENRPENRQGTSFQTFNFVRKHVNSRGPTHIRRLICVYIYIYTYHLLTSRTYRGRRLQVWWRSMRSLYVVFLDPGCFDD